MVSLYACSADPGYEPRYEPQESPPAVTSEPQPQTTARGIEAPPKLVAALQLCADKFALRLPKTSDHYAVLYDLKMDGNGTTAKVKDSMIPGTELEACLTNALEHMEVPEAATSTSQMSPQSRSAVGVLQALAAPIALLPIVLVSGGVTILVGVTIYAIEEVAQALRRRKKWENECQQELTKCLLTDLADDDGSVYGSRRCLMCWDACLSSKGTWPWRFEVHPGEFISCAYWVPQWKR